MRNSAFAVLSLLSLAGCAANPILYNTPSHNPEVSVKASRKATKGALVAQMSSAGFQPDEVTEFYITFPDQELPGVGYTMLGVRAFRWKALFLDAPEGSVRIVMNRQLRSDALGWYGGDKGMAADDPAGAKITPVLAATKEQAEKAAQ